MDIPEKCTVCGSKNIVLVEYDHDHPEHYDGVSEIVCKDCRARVGRWSGAVLNNNEYEYRYGRKSN